MTAQVLFSTIFPKKTCKLMPLSTKLKIWAITSEAYSEPIQTSQMELSARINYRFKSTFFVESSTLEAWLGSE